MSATAVAASTYSQLDEAQLQALMARLAPALRRGAVIYLQGDLGAGKTTVARALIQALGYRRRVKSPTYSLLETYTVPGLTICHLDLYRLGDAREVLDLGLEEMVTGTGEHGGSAGADGDNSGKSACLMLIEWPDKGRGYLPPADVECHLQVCGGGGGDTRDVQLTAHTPHGAAIAAQWLRMEQTPG